MAVPSTLDREQQAVVLPREVDGRTDIRRTCDLGDERRAFVEGGIQDLARPVVAVVAGQQHTPFQPRSEVGNGLGSQRDLSTVARDRL